MNQNDYNPFHSKMMTSNAIFNKAQALVVEEAGGRFKLVDIDVNAEDLRDDEVLIRFHASGIW